MNGKLAKQLRRIARATKMTASEYRGLKRDTLRGRARRQSADDNAGCPAKRCPARMGKVTLRNKHWREIRVIDAVDERGNPAKWHYVSEPVIVERPVRRARIEKRESELFMLAKDPTGFMKLVAKGLISRAEALRVLGRKAFSSAPEAA